MRFSKSTVYVILFVLAAALLLAAQTNGTQQQPNAPTPKPRLSPPGTASCSFADGKTITVAYSRPSRRNRKIMGELVPFDKVWRTGANEATSFETQVPLKVGSTEIPAGKYTLYTIPTQTSWTLIINKQTGQWGTQYDQSQDLARIKMEVKQLSAPVEQFTVSFEKTGDTSCSMKLEWENTSASVGFEEAAATNRIK